MFPQSTHFNTRMYYVSPTCLKHIFEHKNLKSIMSYIFSKQGEFIKNSNIQNHWNHLLNMKLFFKEVRAFGNMDLAKIEKSGWPWHLFLKNWFFNFILLNSTYCHKLWYMLFIHSMYIQGLWIMYYPSFTSYSKLHNHHFH